MESSVLLKTALLDRAKEFQRNAWFSLVMGVAFSILAVGLVGGGVAFAVHGLAPDASVWPWVCTTVALLATGCILDVSCHPSGQWSRRQLYVISTGYANQSTGWGETVFSKQYTDGSGTIAGGQALIMIVLSGPRSTREAVEEFRAASALKRPQALAELERFLRQLSERGASPESELVRALSSDRSLASGFMLARETMLLSARTGQGEPLYSLSPSGERILKGEAPSTPSPIRTPSPPG